MFLRLNYWRTIYTYVYIAVELMRFVELCNYLQSFLQNTIRHKIYNGDIHIKSLRYLYGTTFKEVSLLT